MREKIKFFILINGLFFSVGVFALTAEDYVQLTGVSKAQCVLNGPSQINLSPINIIDTVDKPLGTRLSLPHTFYMQTNCSVPMKIKITAQGVHPITKCLSSMDPNTGIISSNYYQFCLYVGAASIGGEEFLEFNDLTAYTKTFTPDGERIIFNILASQGSYTSLAELSNMPTQLITSFTMSVIVE